MTGFDLPALASISDRALVETLGDLRAQGVEPRGPILYLEAVSCRLRRQALRDTRPNRVTVLHALLRDLAWEGLCASRGLVNGHCPPIQDDCLRKDLASDFRVGRRDRQGWSAVWYRFLSDEAPTGDEVEEMAGVSRQTFWRRQKQGISTLRQALVAAEMEARAGLAGPDLPPAPLPDAEQRLQAVAILMRVKDRLAQDRPDALDLDPADRRLILSRSWDSLDLYRLRQALVWSDERYRLDERFVDLSLLIDRGEDSQSSRWEEEKSHYQSLEAALAARSDPVFVVLGAPGSGKSTLLRHHELGIMLNGLRGATDRISVYMPLSRYGSRDDEAVPPAPLTWLAAQWEAEHPEIGSLPDLLAEQRVTLLLDAVNEMPHRDAETYLTRVGQWQDFIVDLAKTLPGNRVVFSCRSLDYSAPLSTNDLAVPQLRIEPLDNAKVQDFLVAYCPRQADRVWESLKDQPQLGLLRTPFLLRMLALQAERQRQVPTGRAALFSSFIRGALRHEVQGGNRRFGAGPLLSTRDRQRLLDTRQWTRPFDLPGAGLFPPLANLAYAMQDRRGSTESAQIRLTYDAALDILEADLPVVHAEAVLLGGCDLGILDQERGEDDLLFRHQLLQEYFAARKLAVVPRAELAAIEWRADAISPSVEELIASLPPAEPLPRLNTTGWEETMLLAGAMTPDQDAFVDQLAETNLPLAGRCAAQPESKVSEPVKDRLRWALVNRSRDETADLRARIAAGEALGELGDPRFKRCVGAEGVEYLVPPMVRVPGGTYRIGSDEGSYPVVLPRQQVDVEEFWIGQFPVTNAEYACFIKAGGYEDERWWVGEAAQRWWRGEGTDDAEKRQECEWYDKFQREPKLLDTFKDTGVMPERNHQRWKTLLSLSQAEFLNHMNHEHKGGCKRAPRYWQMEWSDNGEEPIVGVSWFESQAYCWWLNHQAEETYHLSLFSEQLAMRRCLASDGDLDGNRRALRLSRLCPVSVFRSSLFTSEIYDVHGNASEWTGDSITAQSRRQVTIARKSSIIELPNLRIGATWSSSGVDAGLLATSRAWPDHRTKETGFRVAREIRPQAAFV